MKRINALISEEVYEVMKNIALDEKVTMTEVLRRGLGLVKYFHEVKKDGGHILIERNGKTFNVEFL